MVRFRVRVGFRVMVRVKDRVRVGIVFKVRVWFPPAILCWGRGRNLCIMI